jgi:hypothetical protein
MTTSKMQFAAYRAHRTMLENSLRSIKNDVARIATEHAIARYDELLRDEPAKVEKSKKPVDRKQAAHKAHVTMLTRRLPNTRGNLRKSLKAEIARHESLSK